MVECNQGNALCQSRCIACANEAVPCSDCSKCVNSGSIACGSYKHVPNLVVAQKVCIDCFDCPFGPDIPCNRCGDRCRVRCSMRRKTRRCS